MTFAISAEAIAIPVNPKIPAIIATIKNVNTQLSIGHTPAKHHSFIFHPLLTLYKPS